MPAQPRKTGGHRSPWAIGALLLLAISATEYGVMLVLPTIAPSVPSRALESAIDSILLTAVLSPVLWLAVVRPLERAAAMRTRHLADLFASIEQERKRVAGELHDGVGQSLTMLTSGLRSLGDAIEPIELRTRAQELRVLAQRALKETKQLALGLRPSLLDDLGLVPAMERIIADVETNHPLKVTLDGSALIDQRLPPMVETTLFRVFQEALNNVVKHANASTATVRLMRDRDSIALEIHDNGCGIAPPRAHADSQAGHLGIVGMRERVAMQGGSFAIESNCEHGTRVCARIPIESNLDGQNSGHVG